MEDHNYHQTEEKFEQLLFIKLRQEEERLEKTKVYLGDAFPRWTSLKRDKSFRSDAEVACFLLDSYERTATTSAPTKEKPVQVKAPAVSGTNRANRWLNPRTTNGAVMPPATSLQPADPRVLRWVVVVPPAATSGLIQRHARDVQDAPTLIISQNQQVPDHLQLQKEQEKGHIKEEQEEHCLKEEQKERCLKEEQKKRCITEEQKEQCITEEQKEHHIKEEQEERRINGEEVEVNLRIKEADTRFPLTSVLVKSENDEKKPQSRQLHQSSAEKNREAELPTSRPGKRMKTQTEDHGGRKQARNSDLNRFLAPNTVGKDLDFTETEGSTEDDDGDTYWQEPISTSGSDTEDSSSDDSNLEEPPSESGSDTEDSSSDYSNLEGPPSESGSDTEDSSSDDNTQETSSLQSHMARHSGKRSSAALGRVKPSTNGQKQFHPMEKQFDCKICRRVLDKSRLLKTQMTPQSGQTLCNFCEKRFRNQT